MTLRFPLALVGLVVAVPIAAAQQFLATPAGAAVDPSSRFDVVVVKAVESGSTQLSTRMLPGRFESTGLPIGLLIRQALQKSDYQIAGLPGWVDTERYAIRASAPETVQPGTMSVMLLNLLKDRFQLVTHVETRDLPVFNLVMVRTDRRPGPALTATSAECQRDLAERLAALKAAAGRGGPPPAPTLPVLPGPNEAMPCGFVRVGTGVVAGSGRTVAELAPMLSDLLARPVIDRTGLAGLYDFSLKFAPEGRTVGPFGLLSPQGPGAQPPPVDPDAPSLSVAVQEQLGLKLESARGPVEVVVIDQIARPVLD